MPEMPTPTVALDEEPEPPDEQHDPQCEIILSDQDDNENKTYRSAPKRPSNWNTVEDEATRRLEIGKHVYIILGFVAAIRNVHRREAVWAVEVLGLPEEEY